MINELKKVDLNIQNICSYIYKLAHDINILICNELFAIEKFMVMFVSYESIVAMNIG